MTKRYMVYGKTPGDKRFAPLDSYGVRTSKKDAELFDTKQDAEKFIDRPIKDGCALEIREVKI